MIGDTQPLTKREQELINELKHVLDYLLGKQIGAHAYRDLVAGVRNLIWKFEGGSHRGFRWPSDDDAA